MSILEKMGSLGEAKGRDMVPSNLDPVVIELIRLQNNIREKERDLGVAHSEIKALKVTESLKDRSIVELSNELQKLEAKLGSAEKHLEYKNLEIKRQIDEKKQAVAAQFAAEATLRRVHANQRDEESISIEAIIAPYESDIRMLKNEIATLKEEKKVSERLIKSKEVALVESERNLLSTHEKVLMVEDLLNQNLELKKKTEICLEENRLLEKSYRQKVVEVEKLSQTICELEESILAGGSVANAIRDYQRQVSGLKDDKRILERELARVKVSADRVATVVANEWKDDSEKVMPVKQWLEERKLLQGETQRLRDKLAVSERSAKAEAQLRDKLKLRLKILEEGLKVTPVSSLRQHGRTEQVLEDKQIYAGQRKRSTSQPRAASTSHKTVSLPQTNSALCIDSPKKLVRTNSFKPKLITGENLIKKNLWAIKSKSIDDNGQENTKGKVDPNRNLDGITHVRPAISNDLKDDRHNDLMSQNYSNSEDTSKDLVSGFLYDKIQKEVINLRKLRQEKDGILTSKDEEIKLLQRKIDALTKALEVESKKLRREVAGREKEKLVSSDDSKVKNGNANNIKRQDKIQVVSQN